MAVDQPGGDETSSRIDPLGLPVLRGQLPLRAHPFDHAVIPRHRCVGDGVNVALTALATTSGQVADVGEHFHAVTNKSVFFVTLLFSSCLRGKVVAELNQS